MKFYKIRDTECDFCGEKKLVVTQVNFTYVCAKCACEINKHARVNEQIVKNESKITRTLRHIK